jgi:hypothetical protein
MNHDDSRAPSAPFESARPAQMLRALGTLVMVFVIAGCTSAARREIEAERLQAHTEPLQLHAPDGLPEASIDVDGSVRIGHEPVALDSQQRVASLAYRKASLAVIDLSLQAASRLTRFAIPRVLFGMVVHGSDDAGRGIEEDAEAIPHSPEFCQRLQDLLTAQVGAVSSLPALRPYANVTPQDVESCRSGRPYDLNL